MKTRKQNEKRGRKSSFKDPVFMGLQIEREVLNAAHNIYGQNLNSKVRELIENMVKP